MVRGPQMSFDRGCNDKNIEISWAFVQHGSAYVSSEMLGQSTHILSEIMLVIRVVTLHPLYLILWYLRRTSGISLCRVMHPGNLPVPSYYPIWHVYGHLLYPGYSTVLGAFGNVTQPVL
ncbi:hypothetical protein BDZ97DRAFT_1765643 [Flammula alnicola]|nr:hypothetical protein BDZ97DRAFT_1765643 [Flammula alnicola]